MTRLPHPDRIVFQAGCFLAILGWAASHYLGAVAGGNATALLGGAIFTGSAVWGAAYKAENLCLIFKTPGKPDKNSEENPMSDDNSKARIQETGYGFSIHQILRDGQISGWKLSLTESGDEMGGGVFPVSDKPAKAEIADALDDAIGTAMEWINSRPDGPDSD